MRAKVPIVTLGHITTGIELDVSIETGIFCRQPARQNTALLKEYALSNSDVVRVYHVFKWFFSNSNAFCANKQFLSSYCHILMFINFLRQKKYIAYIDPYSFKEDRLALNGYRGQSVLLITYLTYLEGNFGQYKISLRKDPYKETSVLKSSGSILEVEAIFENRIISHTISSNYCNSK